MRTKTEGKEKMKEFTFQCIMSYAAEDEDEAWSRLVADLEQSKKLMFEIISEEDVK